MIVPELDVMVSPCGVLAGLQTGMNLPLFFQFGVEPSLTMPPQPIFLEGLPYTEESNSNNVYDSVNKTSLGRNPPEIRACNRCRSYTQVRYGYFKDLTAQESLLFTLFQAHFLKGFYSLKSFDVNSTFSPTEDNS